MSALDILLAIFAAVMVIGGLWKGLARAFLALLGLLAAFFIASRLAGRAGRALSFTGWSEELRSLCGYVVLFACIVFAAEVLGWLTRKLLRPGQLGWSDRLAGGAIALVAALLGAALLILPVLAYAPGGASALGRSILAPYVVDVADGVAYLAPADLAARYRGGVEKLREHWRGDWGREVVTVIGKGAWNGIAGRGPGA